MPLVEHAISPGSAQVSDRGERRREAVGQVAIDVPRLVAEPVDDRVEGALELARVERPDEGGLERYQDLGGQIVGAPGLRGG